ncbi:YeeE/YedE family protein [Thiomicrorhabdus sp. zzn3]|uniref:YeeE/YedE family protein n=1 Tax=Thiomicrorhabdus sp. zzn3 TaxID=3039775 RepID=UPI0024370F11|nr:YeeE/YedE family protein [Thiomicrorhabdus sp. zzn3]MDG6777159.1 YeeE/YedE family protein [Thiomicrorhabdus sp. zzn3]
MPTSKPSIFLISTSLLFATLIAANNLLKEQTLVIATLITLGGLLGATLNYFQFGFSSSFRSLLTDRKTAGMRAIIWMLALAIILFAPLLAFSEAISTQPTGFIRTLSLAIPIGAFLFGIGMQIGCGCTSGTLNRVGQLQPLSFTTLFFMVIGGSVAAYTYSGWQHLPELEPFAFQNQFGWVMGVVIQLSILFLLYQWLNKIERKRHTTVKPLIHPQRRWHPFLLAAFGLATFNTLLLWISGSPWSISSIFPYWGTRLIDALHLPIDWGFWDYAMENSTHLALGPFENTVSLTTMGVIAGAFAVSLFKPRSKVPVNLKGVMGSVIGGTIMGFGAVMASGCNIGAFFSGIASGSLHGWVWFVFALLGNGIGVYLRRYVA